MAATGSTGGEDSILRRSALAVIKSYEEWTIESILSFRTEDCIQLILPASTGASPMSNAAYTQFLSPVLPRIRNFKLTPHFILEDTKSNTITIHATSVADTLTKVGGYGNEYMLVIEFVPGMEKVVDGETVLMYRKFVEFVDSERTKGLMSVLFEGRVEEGK